MNRLLRPIIRWIATTRLLTIPRYLFGEILIYSIAHKNGMILYYNEPERAKVLKIIRNIKDETEMLLSDNEAYQIYMAVQNTQKIPGDIAEVGTYKGGSAKLICKVKGNKSLHLFDTFEGLPSPSTSIDDLKQFKEGRLLASYEKVKNYLKDYAYVYFYKGIFPYTAEPIHDKRFSFVHLDADLYLSTLDSLKFFYPRLNKGGIIISHDYINSPGVRKAFDEFFVDKKEPIIEMSGIQCLIVKVED